MKPLSVLAISIAAVAAAFGIKYGYDKMKNKPTETQPSGGGGGGGVTIIKETTQATPAVPSQPKRPYVAPVIINTPAPAKPVVGGDVSFDADVVGTSSKQVYYI